MRVAKFSDTEFADVAALDAFFAGLPNRNPPGLILIPAGQIRANGLAAGEWVLFTYQAKLRYVARAASRREDNTYEPRQGFPHCFVVDPVSIRGIDLPIGEVERQFREAGVDRSLSGRGWTELDSPAADRIIEGLAGALESLGWVADAEQARIRVFHGDDENTHRKFQAWRKAHVGGFHMTEGDAGQFTIHYTQDWSFA